LILEDLPPIRVSSLDFHFASTTIALDVPWLAVDLGLDSQRSLIEPPNLSFLRVSSLDDQVSTVDGF
jgi:hypothetical protein